MKYAKWPLLFMLAVATVACDDEKRNSTITPVSEPVVEETNEGNVTPILPIFGNNAKSIPEPTSVLGLFAFIPAVLLLKRKKG